MKKIMSLALILALMVVSLPISTGATGSGDWRYTLVTDEGVTTVTITGYTGTGGAVTIPSQIDGYTVTTIGSYAFSGCAGLTNITIPDGVIEIGMGAFSGCAGLTNITIPDGVTIIEPEVFSDCTGLASISIPDGVTIICQWAFSDCTGLTSVTIPNSVDFIADDGAYGAFPGCTGLQTVYFQGTRAEWADKPYAQGVFDDGVTIVCTCRGEHIYDDDNDMTCNLCDHVRETRGDVNGDEEINSDDAIHLLYHTLLPDLYPINQSGDFDGSGDVNSDDAIYLLYYTLLPDLYPLK